MTKYIKLIIIISKKQKVLGNQPILDSICSNFGWVWKILNLTRAGLFTLHGNCVSKKLYRRTDLGSAYDMAVGRQAHSLKLTGCQDKIFVSQQSTLAYWQLRIFKSITQKTFDPIWRIACFSGPAHPNLGYSGAVQYYQVKTHLYFKPYFSSHTY